MSRTIGLTFLVLLLAFSSAISESAEKEVSSESSSLESSSQSEETSNEQGIKSNSGSGSESASHETSTESEGLKSDIDAAAEAHDAGTKKKGPSINVGNTGGLIPPIDVNVHTDINSPHDNKDGHKGHHGHGDKGHDHGDKGHDHGDKGHHGDKGGHGDHSDKHHGGGGIGDIVDSIEALGQAKPMPILPAKYAVDDEAKRETSGIRLVPVKVGHVLLCQGLSESASGWWTSNGHSAPLNGH
ncbi:hypothetical protein AAG570_000341 [Ranatra chinensis]|uniref:Uncharacterized protein n=1 Tax=Ranatra chinensis TaxID=642074 RepID=A0ABD0YWT7_9HEMI